MTEQRGYTRSSERPTPKPTLEAKLNGKARIVSRVSLDDFYAFMPSHNYIYRPTRETWPASSVNARIPPIPETDAKGKPIVDKKGKQKCVPASTWLDRNKPIEQMTWAPGEPELVRDRHVADGGWFHKAGAATFNLYRPPIIKPGNAAEAIRWLDHVHKVFPNQADHIVRWLAHRVQRPGEKINHALVFGGKQGIGKDTLLEPVKQAVGPSNFAEVEPAQMVGRFNGFLQSVILRMSEARDQGEVNRFQLYDRMKAYIAAPPDVLRVDEKFRQERAVINCVGIIITTNYTDSIYLPPDDRRHFVAWSDLAKEDFTPDYWNALWDWYKSGGDRHVAAYLIRLDISSFDPKAPPPKTPAFWTLVDSNHAPEEAELADVLDRLGNPHATTLDRIKAAAPGDLTAWLNDRKNNRAIAHRLEKCGYVKLRNDDAKDGLWRIDGARQAIYANISFSLQDRIMAARGLAGTSSEPSP